MEHAIPIGQKFDSTIRRDHRNREILWAKRLYMSMYSMGVNLRLSLKIHGKQNSVAKGLSKMKTYKLHKQLCVHPNEPSSPGSSFQW